MRRMMHAVALSVFFASTVQAQVSGFKPLPTLPISDKSILVEPQQETAQLDDSVHSSAYPVSTVQPDDKSAVSISASAANAPASVPQYIPFGEHSPYSQLAGFMGSTDPGPCLWRNYCAERAAITAHIMCHVNGQCSCFEGKCQLHATPSGVDCGGAGGCGKGSCAGKTNRYREPFSTFYATPSSVCGNASSAFCKRKAAACSSTGCSSSVSVLFPAADSCQTQCGMGSVTQSNPVTVPQAAIANPNRFAAPNFGTTPGNYGVKR